MSLLTPSGGLLYHLRALRHREQLWAPFRQAIDSWLSSTLLGEGELVLIGPSAGHCLPEAVLRRFQRVLVLEPDPLARWLLSRRLPRRDVRFESRDWLVRPLLGEGAGLAEWLAMRPNASVLFCNLLGQLHFSLPDARYEEFQQRFRERLMPLLAGRAWASFHDRWSLDWRAEDPVPLLRTFPSLPSNDELGAAWFGPSGPPVAVLDHGTSSLFPAGWPRRYFSWQITPAALHVVEGVAGG